MELQAAVFSCMREGDLAWVFPFLLCCAGFRFLVLCFITSDLCCLVRLFFDWRVLPRWFGCAILRLQDWNRYLAAACFASRTAQRKVVELIGIWMFLWCFLLVFSCFLKFICNWFLEKSMPDEGFWIYVFCMENRVFWIIFCAVFLMFCGRRAGILEVLAGCSILCIEDFQQARKHCGISVKRDKSPAKICYWDKKVTCTFSILQK